MADINVGSLVRSRERDWVVLPSSDQNLIRLRPLTGSEAEICGIYKPLIDAGIEKLEPATFSPPNPANAGTANSIKLLWDSTRLTLRDGAAPFRSLARISVRPRPYQFVPLLMALRLDTVRLLIADDVGVGKTIESLLIIREMLDRGEIQRLCVLCPPYLCDQWQSELHEKFHIDAVVLRSGTIGQLERNLPSDKSVYEYYPFIIASIDFVKTDRNRDAFLHHCPEIVIVDEAHGSADPTGARSGHKQRFKLLSDVASDKNRHLILLTATPHSGIEMSFLSLLGLLKPEFGKIEVNSLSEKERDELARHFVQRRRADIKVWMGEDTPFPDRVVNEETYELSPEYKELFRNVYNFSREIVRSSETLSGYRQRIRFWTAIALLRCVMSSPAAAIVTLQNAAKDGRLAKDADDATGDIEDAFINQIYEPTDTETDDTQPTGVIDATTQDLSSEESKEMRRFAALAFNIANKDADTKLKKSAEILKGMLKNGYNPIVWCRYIATSEYVADELKHRLSKEFPDLRIISVTGALSDEERREKVNSLSDSPRRILVATDCLSEGVNLQELFNAVIHYDLPWNPNRLEQRDGRVDRFGQRSNNVKSVLFYGKNNRVDGAVLDVLLRKALNIKKSLGVSVPVPVDSKTIMETVMKALFSRQTTILDYTSEDPSLSLSTGDLDKLWKDAADREKENRTKFAQRVIKPEEVQHELEETDAVLGDVHAVERFVTNACQLLGAHITVEKDHLMRIQSLHNLPEPVLMELPVQEKKADAMIFSFTAPYPTSSYYIGRNTPFVASLAQNIFEKAIDEMDEKMTRSGVIKSSLVDTITVLCLMRCRYSIRQPDGPELLAEDVMLNGYCVSGGKNQWLDKDQIMALIDNAVPEANISPGERSEIVKNVLSDWDIVGREMDESMKLHAEELRNAHYRIRKSAQARLRGLSITPYPPADLIGLLVLQPTLRRY